MSVVALQSHYRELSLGRCIAQQGISSLGENPYKRGENLKEISQLRGFKNYSHILFTMEKELKNYFNTRTHELIELVSSYSVIL